MKEFVLFGCTLLFIVLWACGEGLRNAGIKRFGKTLRNISYLLLVFMGVFFMEYHHVYYSGVTPGWVVPIIAAFSYRVSLYDLIWNYAAGQQWNYIGSTSTLWVKFQKKFSIKARLLPYLFWCGLWFLFATWLIFKVEVQ